MPAAACVCVKCYSTYMVLDQELELPMNDRMQLDPKPKKVLVTWEDWIEHLITHCPNCRFSRPPRSCVQDLQRRKRR